MCDYCSGYFWIHSSAVAENQYAKDSCGSRSYFETASQGIQWHQTLGAFPFLCKFCEHVVWQVKVPKLSCYASLCSFNYAFQLKFGFYRGLQEVAAKVSNHEDWPALHLVDICRDRVRTPTLYGTADDFQFAAWCSHQPHSRPTQQN